MTRVETSKILAIIYAIYPRAYERAGAEATRDAWEMMFEEVPDKNVGLELEPGHQSIQLIDPVAQLREWAPTGRILHMHGKDCTVDRTAVALATCPHERGHVTRSWGDSIGALPNADKMGAKT